MRLTDRFNMESTMETSEKENFSRDIVSALHTVLGP
jgi:hypothetical protein